MFFPPRYRYQQSFYGVDLESLREEAVNEYFKQPIVVCCTCGCDVRLVNRVLCVTWIKYFLLYCRIHLI